MKTIKEITEALKTAAQIEPWMDDIVKDERARRSKSMDAISKASGKDRSTSTSA